jgi:hypothetical protein
MIILGGVGTIVVTLIGTIAGEAFSPLNESIKDFFSPPLNTSISSAVVFDASSGNNVKTVSSGAVTSSPSITFEFDALNGKQKVDNVSFECSIDGSPFEPCISPKAYGDLPSELTHMFQVRAKGILGNTDKSPAKFNLSIVTSSIVEGVFKNKEEVLPETRVSIDDRFNSTTDARGGFFFDEVKREVISFNFMLIILHYHIMSFFRSQQERTGKI